MSPIAAACVVALFYLLHQDLWFWRTARPLAFGVLPVGLFYHALFTIACSILMGLLVRYAWPPDLESGDAPTPRSVALSGSLRQSRPSGESREGTGGGGGAPPQSR